MTINKPEDPGMPEGINIDDIVSSQGFGYTGGMVLRHLLSYKHSNTPGDHLRGAMYYLERLIENNKGTAQRRADSILGDMEVPAASRFQEPEQRVVGFGKTN